MCQLQQLLWVLNINLQSITCRINVNKFCRVSGVTDHYAENDHHALTITRNVIAHFNRKKAMPLAVEREIPQPPLYPIDELYGIVGANLKKSYDIRQVRN